MGKSFYWYQHRRFGVLLAWGLGSVAAGLSVIGLRDPLRRGIAWQAVGWGAIDAGLAIFGRRGAAAAQNRLENGEIGDEEQEKAARGFRKILFINTILDMAYVATGILIATKAKSADRQGLGWGVALQGSFLLGYDGVLTWEVGEKWLND